MTLFLTSSPFVEGTAELSAAYGFLDRLLAALPRPSRALVVASSPDDTEGTERAARSLGGSLAAAGASLASCDALHSGNATLGAALVEASRLVVLLGGHVPTQNAFLRRVGMDCLLRGWDGVVMGISAGSMNSASTVYSLPEEPGEAVDPFYRRFMPGLGLTDTMIIPHFQRIRSMRLDGKRVIGDLACGDSFGRRFYCLPDGSYIVRTGTREELHGPAWLVEDGQCLVANHTGEALLVSE